MLGSNSRLDKEFFRATIDTSSFNKLLLLLVASGFCRRRGSLIEIRGGIAWSLNLFCLLPCGNSLLLCLCSLLSEMFLFSYLGGLGVHLTRLDISGKRCFIVLILGCPLRLGFVFLRGLPGGFCPLLKCVGLLF